MRINDVNEFDGLERNPDKKLILLSNVNIVQNGYKIKLLELRLYYRINQKHNSQSIITAYLETDDHSIEAKYEEGSLDDIELKKSAELLENNLGLSGLILRLIISLDNTVRMQNG